MSNEVNFVTMDREDDAIQILTTHLIATQGLSILEKKADEIQDIIKRTYPALLNLPSTEIKAALAKELETSEDKMEVSDSTQNKIEMESIRTKLFQLIYSRMTGVNFNTISIKSVLEDKKIPLKKLLEKLDTFF
jgi:hypothetical protein